MAKSIAVDQFPQPALPFLATTTTPGAVRSPISASMALTDAELADAKATLAAALGSAVDGFWWKLSGGELNCLAVGWNGVTVYRRRASDGYWFVAAQLAFGSETGLNAQVFADVVLMRGATPATHASDPFGTVPHINPFLNKMPCVLIVSPDIADGATIGVLSYNTTQLLIAGGDENANIVFTVDHYGKIMSGTLGGRGACVVASDNGGKVVSAVAPPLDIGASTAQIVAALQAAGIVYPLGTGFVTQWTVAGDASARTVTLPLTNGNGAVSDGVLDFGDASPVALVKAYNSASRAHTFAADGTYSIEAAGAFEGFGFANAGDKNKLSAILSWGNGRLSGFKHGNLGMFYGCTNLASLPNAPLPASGNGCEELSAFLWAGDANPLITSIPTGFFDLHPNVTLFDHALRGRINLATVPSRLLANAASSSFYAAFFQDLKLQLRADIFYTDGEQGTRFLNKACQFINCFYRDSFTGTQGTAPDLWNCDFGETITLDVAPATDWAGGDTITGQLSGATAVVVAKISTLVYHIKKHFGTFTLGEVIGVTGVSAKLADQGAANPVFVGTPLSQNCFGGAGNSLTSLSNYNSIPSHTGVTAWRSL